MKNSKLIKNARRTASVNLATGARGDAVIKTPEAALGASSQPEVTPDVVRIIPVGQEPRRQDARDASELEGHHHQGEPADRSGHRHAGDKHNQRREGIRDPEGFSRYRNALQETQVFREQTMRHLRRAEVCVWLAIHGCQGKRGAQISHDRLAELTGTSRKHVGMAIKSLNRRGLLEVLVKGRFRPNSNGEKGLASVYRVYPRSEGQSDEMQVSG